MYHDRPLQSYIYEFAPAVWLERTLSYSSRSLSLVLLGSLTIIVGLLTVASLGLAAQWGWVEYVTDLYELSGFLVAWRPALVTVGWWLFALTAALFALHAFTNAYLFRGLAVMADEGDGSQIDNRVTFEVADCLLEEERWRRSVSVDMTRAFLESQYGRETMLRLGITDAQTNGFLSRKQSPLPLDVLERHTNDEPIVTMPIIAHVLINQDQAFREFLFKHSVQAPEFYGAVRWMARTRRMKKRRQQWWTRERLGRISGLGRSLAYGNVYTLERFSKPIGADSVFAGFSLTSDYAHDTLRELEQALLKAQDANALLIGEEGVGKIDIILQLEQDIRHENVLPQLKDKQLYLLDTNAIITASSGKDSFEKLFNKILVEATQAGNIIMVIENLPSLLQSVKAYGSDAADILAQFLSSPVIQVIGTTTPASYHRSLESDPQLGRRFERIFVEDTGDESTIQVLEDIARRQEGRAIVTYDAIEAIATGAKRYLVDPVLPDSAIDVLLDVLSSGQVSKDGFITREIVEDRLARKTGVSIGQVDEDERGVLTNLEEILHERVIGQDEAISAVSQALRRNRSGIEDPDKPIGSFLFFGPTGVGKTETTKALAATYFGGEQHIERLDMSEFSSAGSVDRLIGDSQEAGVLANMVREHPYGVLLLDEFEKADESVHDLFLQTLDEGHFTDGRGRTVNVRNMIIIATSNAGADLIYKHVSDGTDITEKKNAIIEKILSRHTFKPELVNRFDAVVLFHPLSESQIREVALLQLDALKERIYEQGYELSLGEGIIDYLIQYGYDPKFGARSMSRVIQDKVESAVASKIIEGKLQTGDTIELRRADIENAGTGKDVGQEKPRQVPVAPQGN